MNIDNWRMQLEAAGYHHAENVYEHGEYAVRGAILDIYPMGSNLPYRIDLFDDEIETLRTFDPETQRSIDRIEQIELLPAHEFPWHKEARSGFRSRWFEHFPHSDKDSPVYQDVSNGITPPGIEYYLPLFFEQTATLFDYLPASTLVFTEDGLNDAVQAFDSETRARHEDRRHDRLRPILPPSELFLLQEEVFSQLKRYPRVTCSTEPTAGAGSANCAADALPDIAMDGRAADPAGRLKRFLNDFPGRVLICAESSGRREALIENLESQKLKLSTVANWQEFLDKNDADLAITIAPMEQGMVLPEQNLALITETALFGERVLQRRRREKPTEVDDAGYRDLSELRIGSPVVHIDHGVGRYKGLETISAGGESNEFLTLEYAGGSKLYVPVSSLHLISRYAGADEEHAPLHKLGTERWSNAKQKALEKIRDTAAELLDVYARREARKGFQFEDPKEAYRAFAAGFPFEETPDQQVAIQAVFEDMTSEQPMDRLVCGD
ncbi:MAG: CarD family transcriptional regulator, partial [Roseibium sp.]